MTTWSIPAKTFLVGEYAAITGAPAIVLTTYPCFEFTLLQEGSQQAIHPDSPAGRWWAGQGYSQGLLHWFDPYSGCGGLGASSAQFLGAYLAGSSMQGQWTTQQNVLDAYLQYAWVGEGARPSGYDVLAQSLYGCVYIDKASNLCKPYYWPFHDLSFLLVHTGKKLATHDHLQTLILPSQMDELSAIVSLAKGAFDQSNSLHLTEAVTAYHEQLVSMHLVAEHTIQAINFFKMQPHVLAVKGCGAMGSDVLLFLVQKDRQAELMNELSKMNGTIVATGSDLYVGSGLIENNMTKKLEILQ